MPPKASSKKLLEAIELAHGYVNCVSADLRPGEIDWHTKGCAETIRKQLGHLTGAERYFAGRMGWRVPEKIRGEHPLDEYARLLEMYRRELGSRRGKISLAPFAGRDQTGDHAGWVVMRMCFHALFHAPRITLLRRQRNPRWKPPAGPRWGRVCDFITTLVGS
jgi:hypothetical protein